MRCSAAARQEPGRRKHEGARANGQDARASFPSRPQGIKKGIGNRQVRTSPSRHDDRSSFIQKVKPAISEYTNPALRSHLAFIYAGDRKLIPILTHLRAWQPEHLDGHAELEGAKPVIGKDDDAAIDRRKGRAGFGMMLTLYGIHANRKGLGGMVWSWASLNGDGP